MWLLSVIAGFGYVRLDLDRNRKGIYQRNGKLMIMRICHSFLYGVPGRVWKFEADQMEIKFIRFSGRPWPTRHTYVYVISITIWTYQVIYHQKPIEHCKEYWTRTWVVWTWQNQGIRSKETGWRLTVEGWKFQGWMVQPENFKVKFLRPLTGKSNAKNN